MIGDFLHTDVVAREDGAEVDLAPAKAEPTTLRDRDDWVVQRIFERRQSSIRPGRWAIYLGRVADAQCLVRALIVVLLDKVIELRLLLQEVLAWRLGRFLLQREMHAFMPAILLRLSRLDTFKGGLAASHHTESLLKPKNAVVLAEGHAIVGAARLAASRGP